MKTTIKTVLFAILISMASVSSAEYGYYSEEGDEITKAILSRGQLFGEKAILGESKRDEFAQSLDDSTSICQIGVETMHELMRNNQTFSFKVYKFIGFKFKLTIQ